MNLVGDIFFRFLSKIKPITNIPGGNPRILKMMNLLAQKRNIFWIYLKHLDWMDLFFLFGYPLEHICPLCDTMLGIRCVGVLGCQSEISSVCFGVKPTQKSWAQDLCARPEVNEGRKVPEEGISRRELKRSVGLREQSGEGEGHRQQKSASGFWESFARVQAHVSSQNTPAFALSWLKSVFVRLFFSSTRLVVFCVSVKERVIPLVGDERNH